MAGRGQRYFQGVVLHRSTPPPQVDLLASLLAGYTTSNRHGEVDWGPPVGREVW